MLSEKLSKEIYKEVEKDVVCRLSVGLGVEKEELYRLLGLGEEDGLGLGKGLDKGLGKGLGNGLGNGLGEEDGLGLGKGLGNGLDNGLDNGLGNGLGEEDGLELGKGLDKGLDKGEGRKMLNSVLPWCGMVIEECCKGLKLNNGLYTQCSRIRGENEYCGSCLKLMEKNGGSLPYGNVDDRLRSGILDYVDPKGKRTVPFANVMKKLNISKEEAIKEAEKLGWVIPECHFEEKKGKRGRPKKDSSAEDTVSECSDGEKKKRGRPKKNKEVVSNNAGEDLIASLLEQENSKEEKNEELIEELIEEEEETPVIKFDIEGRTYLKSEDNVLYDMESHDAIGIWNEERNKIEELPEDDEED